MTIELKGEYMNLVFDKLNEIINEYDCVIAMGHKDPDLDSLGSCLGIIEIVESLGKNGYLFLNYNHLENYNTNINQAFLKMKKNISCIDGSSYKKVDGKTLLVITDVHIKERLEYPELLKLYDVIVLDHHIKDKKYIKDTKFMYIDTNLSSMSEFITYYAEYDNVDLDNVIATILLSGIEIDTNGFNVKTTNMTYEAASLLMEMGADSILKQELLKETKEEYMKRASYIKDSFMVNDNIAMCIIHHKVDSKELAEVAEELLTFEDVKAAYALGLLDVDLIGVSARSLGEIDVSDVMKKMGGGGHMTNAACQIKNKTLREIKQEIIDILNE